MKLLAFAGSCFALVAAVGASADSRAQSTIGERPFDSLGTTLDGTQVLASHHHGKVVVVTFWAAWCAPCRLELPQLEGMQRVAGPGQLKVVAINIENRAEFRRAARVLGELQLTVTHDSTGAIFNAYGAQAIPHLVVIGRDGRIQKVFHGYSEKQVDDVIAEVNAALAEK